MKPTTPSLEAGEITGLLARQGDAQTGVAPKLRTPILSESVKDLHCKPDAPYPSEMMQAIRDSADVRTMILAWRRAQERVVLKEVK